jgi:oligopeptide transport system substrate-binding protein
VNEAGEDLYEKYAGQDYVEVTDEVIADINYMLVNGWGWTEDPNNYLYMAFYEGEAATWDQVGFFKTGDYEITVILYNPLSEFFFKYYAENFGLVNEEKYEAGKTQTGDMIKTDYATSVDTYMSYGPYKLVSYQADKEFRLTRNENWYGWTDGKHDGLYQTTDIVGSIITDTTTQELLFLQGQLDALTLTADNLSNYQGSDYMVYLTTATLYYLNINNDLEALTEQQSDGVNMTILTNAEFRKGISLAINRSEYVAQMGYGAPLYGYFNNSFLADVDSGEVYRSSEAGENVLKTFYGVSDVSEITGYDLAAARECLVAGYEQAVADGLVKETDRFEFAFPTWDQETSSVRQVTFMQNALDAATEGTVLEGRITVKMVVSENYYSMLDSGEYGICISGWIGDEYNPYVLMQDFVTGDNAAQSLLGFDPYTETLDIELSGETVTHTYYDWYDLLCNGEYSLADSDVRNQILSQMELSLLQMYRDCPFYSSSSAVLLSMKTNYPTYEPVMGNNLGGLRRMTYNYTDAEWETYCAANNNQLNYN